MTVTSWPLLTNWCRYGSNTKKWLLPWYGNIPRIFKEDTSLNTTVIVNNIPKSNILAISILLWPISNRPLKSLKNMINDYVFITFVWDSKYLLLNDMLIRLRSFIIKTFEMRCPRVHWIIITFKRASSTEYLFVILL